MAPAIVLAAGASARMGTPKPLLMLGGKTFLRRVLDALRDGGVSDVVVVVRPDAFAIETEVALAGFGRPVRNPRPDDGQLSSLLTGLDAIDAPGIDRVMVTLADVPAISAGAVRALLDRAAISPAPIVRAAHQGRHGHPVIFGRAVFDALRGADRSIGAKAVFAAFAVEDVEVHDPGVLEDVDTPADYARVRGYDILSP